MYNQQLSSLWEIQDDKGIIQWCNDYIDFSLVPDYETPLHIKYNADFTPFWQEPLESLIDPNYREVVIWKPSRAGCSEAVALNIIRYLIANDPTHIMYLGSQQEATERYFEERICKGINAIRGMQDKPRRIVGTRCYINGTTLTASYPLSKSSDKMFGYRLCVVDEASLCPSGTVDTLRKRLDTYRDGHLLILSSLDARQTIPTKEDAIYIEWANGDQREWFLQDKFGKEFILKSGNEDTSWGLKWDPKARDINGKWNLTRVYETAHYVTPSGEVWNNDEKNRAVKNGRWIATNPNPTDKRKRSYRLDSLNLPFLNGDLGHYAVEFIKAKEKGSDALRTFIYENKCEEWKEKEILNTESSIKGNIEQYLVKNRISDSTAFKGIYQGKKKTVLMSVDVHKERKGLYWVIREWVEGGDSGLIDFGNVLTWDEIKNLMLYYGVSKLFVDGSYNTEEIKQTLILPKFHQWACICFGRESIKEAYQTKYIDPYESTVYQGKTKLISITHNPNYIKNDLHRLINKATDHIWGLPIGVDLTEYLQHLQSEKLVNGKWIEVSVHNHYLDCEVMQLLGAKVLGIYKAVVAVVTPSSKDSNDKPDEPDTEIEIVIDEKPGFSTPPIKPHLSPANPQPQPIPQPPPQPATPRARRMVSYG